MQSLFSSLTFSLKNKSHFTHMMKGKISFRLSESIPALENYKIIQVACGVSHSMALDEWGQVYTWGSNSQGQLGNDTINPAPRPVKALATKHIIQIASGQYHCLVLTNSKSHSVTSVSLE